MANRAFWESRFAQEAYVYGTEPNALCGRWHRTCRRGVRWLWRMEKGETPFTWPSWGMR